jgi:hypothetical protein
MASVNAKMKSFLVSNAFPKLENFYFVDEVKGILSKQLLPKLREIKFSFRGFNGFQLN